MDLLIVPYRYFPWKQNIYKNIKGNKLEKKGFFFFYIYIQDISYIKYNIVQDVYNYMLKINVENSLTFLSKRAI